MNLTSNLLGNCFITIESLDSSYLSIHTGFYFLEVVETQNALRRRHHQRISLHSQNLLWFQVHIEILSYKLGMKIKCCGYLRFNLVANEIDLR